MLECNDYLDSRRMVKRASRTPGRWLVARSRQRTVTPNLKFERATPRFRPVFFMIFFLICANNFSVVSALVFLGRKWEKSRIYGTADIRGKHVTMSLFFLRAHSQCTY